MVGGKGGGRTIEGGRFVGPPAPSMTYIKWYVLLLLVRHPLIVSPPGGLEKIARWRMYDGIEAKEGLTCSVYSYANLNEKEALPRPDTQNVSVLYEDNGIGSTDSEGVTYSVSIKLHYRQQVTNNRELISVPLEAALHPREWLHTSNQAREIELWTNPPMDLFGHYMGLIRLALLDPVAKSSVPGPEFNIDVLYENHKDRPWEAETNILYQEAEMLVQIKTNISRGWRDRWNCSPTSIRVLLNP